MIPVSFSSSEFIPSYVYNFHYFFISSVFLLFPSPVFIPTCAYTFYHYILYLKVCAYNYVHARLYVRMWTNACVCMYVYIYVCADMDVTELEIKSGTKYFKGVRTHKKDEWRKNLRKVAESWGGLLSNGFWVFRRAKDELEISHLGIIYEWKITRNHCAEHLYHVVF